MRFKSGRWGAEFRILGRKTLQLLGHYIHCCCCWARCIASSSCFMRVSSCSFASSCASSNHTRALHTSKLAAVAASSPRPCSSSRRRCGGRAAWGVVQPECSPPSTTLACENPKNNGGRFHELSDVPMENAIVYQDRLQTILRNIAEHERCFNAPARSRSRPGWVRQR